MKQSYRYKDFDINFEAHPVSKDVSKKYDTASVMQSIKNLLVLNHYDKPFEPDIGCNVSKLLFEPLTQISGVTIKKMIETTIRNYEPRCELRNVNVYENETNMYEIIVEITFSLINTTTPVTFTTTLNRI